MKRQLIVLGIAVLLFLGSVISAHAETNPYGFKSQGRIVFTNGTEDTSDDVIFDASDFTTLANKCR